MNCDESHLTGESESIKKEDGDELYMDSNILSGNAVAVVEKVGMNTEIGEIAGIIQEESDETPLKRKSESWENTRQ